MSSNQEYFDTLEKFKKWVQKDLKKHCETSYGKDIYAQFISGCVDDMLVSLECILEELGEAATEEYDYDESEENDNTDYDIEFNE